MFDAVLAPNDNNAANIITILDKNKKTVPVSGQDASVAGLQNVLLGKQTATVYKPFTLEATAASDLAIALLKGEKPTADKTLADGTPYVAVTPVLVGPDKVKDVVAAGDATPYFVHAAATAAVQISAAVASPAATTSLTLSGPTSTGVTATYGVPSARVLSAVGFSPLRSAIAKSDAAVASSVNGL